MQPEWKKLEFPSELGNLGKNLQDNLEQMKSSLEEQTHKIQHLMDILLVELQKHSNPESK